MKLLKTPWKYDFLDLVKNSKQKIRISSPFIMENICDEIITYKNEKSKIDLITSFKILNLYSGSLDINGIEKLINIDTTVKNHSRLHAKIYVFDDKKAIISSGNLTNGGLVNNYEYGIFLDEKAIVYQIIEDFEILSNNSTTGTIKLSDIHTIRKIISKIPKSTKIDIPKFSLEKTNEVISINVNDIATNLNGWKKQVFIFVDKIENQVFSLNDIYKYEVQLSNLYPNNKNIKDKIRQQLQILRDLGLIEFLGNGEYKKLWKQSE